MKNIGYLISGVLLLLTALWGTAFLCSVFEDGSPFELASLYTGLILVTIGIVLVYQWLVENE
jgi:hypothetical protein